MPRGVDTRGRLLEEALVRFAERGVREVSIRELCKAVAIREGSFYSLFPSKQALVEALFSLLESRLRVAEETAEQRAARAEAMGMRGFLRHYQAVSDAAWEVPQNRLLWRFFSAERLRDPRVEGLLAAEARHRVALTRSTFHVFHRMGVLQGDPDGLALVYASGMAELRQALRLATIHGGDGEAERAAITAFIEAFCDAVLKEQA